MGFSCCGSGQFITAAIAELILSPVALVAPDPILFSTVGLSPMTATNPVGTDHTVTAFAQAAQRRAGPGCDDQLQGSDRSQHRQDGYGHDRWRRQDELYVPRRRRCGHGHDPGLHHGRRRTLSSNIVTKIWGLACDVNNDGKVTNADLLLIRTKNDKVAPGRPIRTTRTTTA